MTSLFLPSRLVARRCLASLPSSFLSSRSYADRESINALVNRLESDPLLANQPDLLPPMPTPNPPPSSSSSSFSAPHLNPTPQEIAAQKALAEHRAQLYSKTEDLVSSFESAKEERQRRLPPPVPADATVPFATNAIPQAVDPMLDFFVNIIMKHGMKLKATIILHSTLDRIAKMTSSPPIPLFKAAILKAAPYARLRKFKKGAKMIYIPVPISERQQVRTAIEWIIDAADKRPYRSVDRRLAGEILAILAGDSPVLRKLDDRHKQAMINRANLPRELGPMMVKSAEAKP